MGIIECFSKSFYDFKAYNKMKDNTTGKTVLYLLLISLLFGIISSVRPIIELRKVKEEILSQIEVSNPKVENGVLSVNNNEPKEYTFENYKIVIDTSDKTNEDKLMGFNNGLIFGSKDVKFKSEVKEMTGETYSKMGIENLSKEKVNSTVVTIFKVLMPVVVVYLIIQDFIGGFILALLIGCILLAISSVMKAHLSFGKIYKMSIYILTPIYLVDCVLALMSVPMPFYLEIVIGLIFGFVIIKSIAQEQVV